MFGYQKQMPSKLLGTPTKKRKLNQPQDFQDQNFQGLKLTRKKSLLDYFQFVGNVGGLSRKDSIKFPLLKKQSLAKPPFSLSFFNENDEPEPINSILKMNIATAMDLQNQRLSQSSEDQAPKQIKLVKRITMFSKANLELQDSNLPRLYRCNSNIDIDQNINEVDERKYGDNIYIEQINQLQRKNTNKSKENSSKLANKAFNKNFKQNYDRKAYRQEDQSDEEEQNLQQRLLKDYQIASSLHVYVKNHENYLCLNKLQRIFYYVKKINFVQQKTQQQIYDLCQLQVRLYNRDDQGHMLRFYQIWEEDQCVYLVFETASTSLQEKLVSSIKLRENQVWKLLTDICDALTWMKSNDQYHLNIKPGNLLRCRQKYKLSDPFVNCEPLSKALNMFKGEKYQQYKLSMAFSYAAPEIMQFRSLLAGLQFHKCDIYSLGLCILQNITGMPVSILKKDLKTIKANNEKYLKGYSRALRNILIKMVSLDPTKRPTSQEICNIKMLDNFILKPKTNNGDLQASTKKRKMSM